MMKIIINYIIIYINNQINYHRRTYYWCYGIYWYYSVGWKYANQVACKCHDASHDNRCWYKHHVVVGLCRKSCYMWHSQSYKRYWSAISCYDSRKQSCYYYQPVSHGNDVDSKILCISVAQHHDIKRFDKHYGSCKTCQAYYCK